MRDTIDISPTIWMPVLLGLVLFGFAFGTGFGEGLADEIFGNGDDNTREIAADCFSDLLVKQQTAQIGRYGNVHGLGGNTALTRGVLKSICEDAWSVDGPQHSPSPYACDVQLSAPGGTPYPDPDCATPTPSGESPTPNGTVGATIDASPTVQTPTPTVASLPDTGGRP